MRVDFVYDVSDAFVVRLMQAFVARYGVLATTQHGGDAQGFKKFPSRPVGGLLMMMLNRLSRFLFSSFSAHLRND